MITKAQSITAKSKFVKKYYKYPPINGVGIGLDENKEFAVCVLLEEGQKPDSCPDKIDEVNIIYRLVGKIEAY